MDDTGILNPSDWDGSFLGWFSSGWGDAQQQWGDWWYDITNPGNVAGAFGSAGVDQVAQAISQTKDTAKSDLQDLIGGQVDSILPSSGSIIAILVIVAIIALLALLFLGKLEAL